MPRKDHLDVQPEIVNNRLSGMQTTSEVARARALAKVGLDLDWYNTRLEELRDTNGDPCCESCGQPEKKKKPGGAIKDLVVTKSKTLVCQSCANKNYKETRRLNVSRRDDRAGAESAERFWERNRARLSEEERRAYAVREDEILHLTQALAEHMRGEGWDAEGLPETIREFCDEVSQHGTLATSYSAFEDWWKDEERNKRAISQGGANATFFKFGFHTAIPDFVAHPFFQFAEQYLRVRPIEPHNYGRRVAQILSALDGKEYVDPDLILACSTKGCGNTEVRNPTKIYPAQFFCTVCETERNRLARAAVSVINQQKLAEHRADSKTDSWGRDKIFGEGYGD